MTPNQYVYQVVQQNTAQNNAAVQQAGQELYPMLQSWAGEYLDQVQYSGSYSKGTAIIGSTDVDLFISLKSNTPISLRDIYNNLLTYVSSQGYSPDPRNVSMRIIHNGLAIDLVPGRRQSPYTYDHSLYRRRADTWTKTNINEHIDIIKNSDRIIEIKAMKLWKSRHNLEFPSFYLEMVTLKALSGYQIGNVGPNMVRVLEWIRDNIEAAVILDPSNGENRVSDDLTQAEKNLLVQWANWSLGQNWENVIW